MGRADFAAVPVHGAVGAGIALGEWLDGSKGFSAYRHALVYDGWWEQTPPGRTTAVGDRAPQVLGSGAGHYVFEAHPDGARRRRLDGLPEDIPGSLWSTGAFPLTPAQRDSIQALVAAHLGTGYSPLDYFALAAHRLHVPAPGLQAFIASSGHMICSQLVDWLYASASPACHLFDDGRWPGYVTPYDLAARVTERAAVRGLPVLAGPAA